MQPSPPLEFIPANTRAFRRTNLPVWDAQWDNLTPAARRAFLAAFEPPSTLHTGVPAGSIPGEELAALEGGGFVGRERRRGEEVVALSTGVADFVARLRSLTKFPVLTSPAPEVLLGYLSSVFAGFQLNQQIERILRLRGVPTESAFGSVLDVHVATHRWPDWVAAELGDPLAAAVVAALDRAEGPVPLAGLPALVGGAPGPVRQAVEKLVALLGVFEGLDPDGLRLVVGFLPAVRADRERVRHPAPPPRWEPVTPERTTPETGPLVPGLAELLLELAAEPVRLKAGGLLYQKDEDRLVARCRGPAGTDGMDDAALRQMVSDAVRLAERMNLTDGGRRKGVSQVRLSHGGREWLKLPSGRQFAAVYRFLRERGVMWSDEEFLGSAVTAVPVIPGQPANLRQPSHTLEDRLPLRQALARVVGHIPADAFIPLEAFLAWGRHPDNNPLLLGREPRAVAVWLGEHAIPALDDHLRHCADVVLERLIKARLLTLGCLQGGYSGTTLLIRRTPRLDWYFGLAEPADEVAGPTHVVVQPDFSVLVIGPDPGPAADLAPFCVRTFGTSSGGAVTYALSRESVTKALAAGLSGQVILERLNRHLSHPLPANVAREVKEWCDRIRTVQPRTAILLPCPDAETADRVQGVLGRKVERLNETTLLWGDGTPTGADRTKLQQAGVLLEDLPGAGHKRRG